ncbi:hypothetical protein GXW71_01965 [Roseomonas hellenica]|uniref:Uncharacterized protein n=1 Tax=Plastoroseomonas hellenica TaxID=2687306 RepID=A0ABS5ES33_9PROT|nr:hypothetical protein [Plastoroseomonas hellenica]MBR0663111.1 hypothetical protein [Plastoroseomonas hellenica]
MPRYPKARLVALPILASLVFLPAAPPAMAQQGPAAGIQGGAAPFAVRPQDAANFPPLQPDQPVAVQLRPRQSAFFRIAPEAGGDVVVITRRLGRGTDTVLQVLDGNGRSITEDDDGGDEQLASRVEIAAGDRAALVRAGILGDGGGSFEVLLTRAAPAPPQNFAMTLGQAAANQTPVATGQAIPIRLRRNQQAFFRLPEGDLLAFTQNLARNTDTVLALLDGAGRVLVEDDDGGEGLASLVEVAASQRRPLFLRAGILGNGAGQFELMVQAAPPAPPADFPTTLVEAATRPALSVGQTTRLTLRPRQAAYFRLPEGERDLVALTRGLSQGADTVLALVDGSGRMLSQDDDGGDEQLASRVEISASHRQPLFLRAALLGNEGGSFDLALEAFVAPPPPNFPTSVEAANAAPPLAVGQQVPIRLTAGQSAYFRLPDGDLIALTRALVRNTDTVLAVLDAQGNVVAEDDDGGGGLASRIEITAGERRPLILRAGTLDGGAGGFELVLEGDAPQAGGGTAFPTSLAAAAAAPVLGLGEPVAIRLRRGQQAFFRVPEGAIAALTRNLQDNTDTVLALLDETGAVLVEDDDGGGGLASRLLIEAERKRPLFIRASVFGDSTGGRFELMLERAMPR